MQNTTTQAIPILRITPSSLIVYYLNTENFQRSEKQIENEQNLTRGMYNGYMSPKTKSKVKRYLGTWFDSIKELKRRKSVEKLAKKPYLTFVTLTLTSIQKHHDNEIKRKCLTPFIETMKRKYDVWNYFWRAEAQENGNIHFHIIIDSYIDHVKLRDEWNSCINKLEYIDEFEKKHGHRNPNSTDIHGLKDIRSIESYVIKYCCKHDGYRGIEGRIHGCSDKLKTLTPYELILEVEDYDIIEKALESKPFFQFNDPCFIYIALPVLKLLKAHSPRLLKELNDYNFKIGLDMYERKHRSQTLSERSQNLSSQKKVEIEDKMKSVIMEAVQLNIEYKMDWSNRS